MPLGDRGERFTATERLAKTLLFVRGPRLTEVARPLGAPVRALGVPFERCDGGEQCASYRGVLQNAVRRQRLAGGRVEPVDQRFQDELRCLVLHAVILRTAR